MAISIVLWFLASFPKVDQPITNVNPIHYSYAGRIGHAIEPVIQPLGFDWKIGIGLLTSFAAREVMVSTMATIYNVEATGDNIINLREAMRNDVNVETGKPAYTPLVALALMVFYVFAAQCMATFAIVRQETNSWKWPLFMIAYLTILAYLGGLICVSRWVIIRFQLMNWQTIIAGGIGLVAIWYIIGVFLRQLKKPEVDPKCDDCPVPDIMDDKRESK